MIEPLQIDMPTGFGHESGSFFGKATTGFFAFYSLGLHKLFCPRNLRNGQFSGAACPCNSRKGGCRLSSSDTIYILREARGIGLCSLICSACNPGSPGFARLVCLFLFLSLFPSFFIFIRCLEACSLSGVPRAAAFTLLSPLPLPAHRA